MVRWKSISFASFLLAILAHFLTLRFPFRDRTMEAVGESQQRAISAENAASTALVEAEAALQALLQRHRPGSPIVDAAVTELANRNDEYANACDASVQADAAAMSSFTRRCCALDTCAEWSMRDGSWLRGIRS
jgi:hypothetical protein